MLIPSPSTPLRVNSVEGPPLSKSEIKSPHSIAVEALDAARRGGRGKTRRYNHLCVLSLSPRGVVLERPAGRCGGY